MQHKCAYKKCNVFDEVYKKVIILLSHISRKSGNKLSGNSKARSDSKIY